jgi:hypothetical protein
MHTGGHVLKEPRTHLAEGVQHTQNVAGHSPSHSIPQQQRQSRLRHGSIGLPARSQLPQHAAQGHEPLGPNARAPFALAPPFPGVGQHKHLQAAGRAAAHDAQREERVHVGEPLALLPLVHGRQHGLHVKQVPELPSRQAPDQHAPCAARLPQRQRGVCEERVAGLGPPIPPSQHPQPVRQHLVVKGVELRPRHPQGVALGGLRALVLRPAPRHLREQPACGQCKEACT